MKKLLLILSFFLLITSCTVMKTVNVYQKFYPQTQETESIGDVYFQLKTHEVDSLPLDSWLTLQAPNDAGYILQKSVYFRENEKTTWKFIYTTFVQIDTSFYSLKVLAQTKDKKLQRSYGR